MTQSDVLQTFLGAWARHIDAEAHAKQEAYAYFLDMRAQGFTEEYAFSSAVSVAFSKRYEFAEKEPAA
jgi:hypothetical protein